MVSVPVWNLLTELYMWNGSQSLFCTSSGIKSSVSGITSWLKLQDTVSYFFTTVCRIEFKHDLRIGMQIWFQVQKKVFYITPLWAHSDMCHCDDNCGEETFLLLHDSHRLPPCGFGFSFLMRDPAQASLECNWKQLHVNLMFESASCHTKALSAQWCGAWYEFKPICHFSITHLKFWPVRKIVSWNTI